MPILFRVSISSNARMLSYCQFAKILGDPSLESGIAAKPLAPAGYQLNVPPGRASSLIAALEKVPPERRASWRMQEAESGETLAEAAVVADVVTD